MKYRGTVLFVCAILINSLSAQTPLEKLFDPIVGKTWVAHGKWGNGSAFRQIITFSYDLNNTIVKVESSGFTNLEQTKFGPRNHGIRQLDTATNTIRFWEFDVFGAVTTGSVWGEAENIYYQYQYGETVVTDAWIKVNDHTYDFKVGVYKDGIWDQIFLSAQFKADPNVPNLATQLTGKWIAKAWDGELQESWKVGTDGHLHQSTFYLEQHDTLYRSHSKIEKVDDQYILFSVIENSPAKIFKAKHVSSDKILFENTDYSNPDKVVYEFLPNGTFHRTISGKENGTPTSYTFQFKKVN